MYIGGLPERAGARDIEKLFEKYGRVKGINVKSGFAFIEYEDGRDADDAVYDLDGKPFMGERVMVQIARGTPHGRDRERWGGEGRGGRGGHGGHGGHGDRRMSPERGERPPFQATGGQARRASWLEKYGPPERTDYRIVVENLSTRVSWQDLKDYMRQAGEVTYADAHNETRGEGIVEFASRKDMEKALDMLDGCEFNGKNITLIREKHRRSGSGKERKRSLSRSPRRSRSPDVKGSERSRSRSREPVV